MTQGEAIITGLTAYWTGVLRKDTALERAGSDLIGIILEWREEQAMLTTIGADGAA